MKAFAAFQMAVFGLSAHDASPESTRVLALLLGFGTFLWFLAPPTALQYGPADKLTVLVCAATALVTPLVFFWWQPLLAVGCCVAAAVGLLIWVRKPEGRRALIVLTLAVLSGFHWGVGDHVVRRCLHQASAFGPLGRRPGNGTVSLFGLGLVRPAHS
jgi:hypothetical protein